MLRRYLPVLPLLLLATPAWAAGDDPVVPILLGLTILFAAARLGAFVALRLGQPAVLGELIAGVCIGNLTLAGVNGLGFIGTTDTFSIFASIGVILLLFEVGLESSISDLMKVGLSSTLVAVVGVITPFAMGWGASAWLMPESSVYVHAFIGATLSATSVGITARVLKDLGKLHMPESKIILGAAVIDDVLALIILAVVQGAIIAAATGGDGVGATTIAVISLKAFGFLVVALVVGQRLAPLMFRLGAKLNVEGMLLTLVISFCFLLSYLASVAGLAPIVGAFAAGLIIHGVTPEAYFSDREGTIEDLLLPISRFFVPIFFVLMGTKVQLAALADTHVVTIALVLTGVALVSKQVCGLAAMGSGLNRLVIGLGMIPRGEVGLIFAMIGSSLVIGGERIIDANLYSAIVIMVMVTTMVTPPALKWALGRRP